METIEVPDDRPVYSFNSKQAPAVWVKSGTRVKFRPSDESYRAMTGELIDSGRVNFQKVNRLVGPVGIQDARRGDALGVRIESIEVGPRAFMVYPARWRSRTFRIPESMVLELPIREGFAYLPDGGRVAAHPMIGCIGVAPSSGSVSALSPASPTGGNMDLVELVAGATIWLPVQIDGALLSLGDLHVRMGRGEAVGAGLECGGTVIALLSLARNVELTCPVVMDSAHIHFIGMHAEESPEAEHLAVGAAWEWLAQDVTLSEATRLSICASLLDVNHGGPAGANVVASFRLDELTLAGVDFAVFPLRAS